MDNGSLTKGTRLWVSTTHILALFMGLDIKVTRACVLMFFVAKITHIGDLHLLNIAYYALYNKLKI